MTDRPHATHPFSTDELVSAFALLLPPEEAKRLAEPSVPADAPLKWRVSPDGLRHAPVPSENLTEDTLILLSLVSDDLALRVAAFRAECGLDEDRGAKNSGWRAAKSFGVSSRPVGKPSSTRVSS